MERNEDGCNEHCAWNENGWCCRILLVVFVLFFKTRDAPVQQSVTAEFPDKNQGGVSFLDTATYFGSSLLV